MKFTKRILNTAITLISFSLLIVSCGSSDNDRSSALIWGSVDLAIPQDSAHVKVHIGEDLVWEGMCTDGDFSGRASVPLGKDVRVVVTENLLEGTPFHGTLSLYEEEYTDGEHLEVNLYTTLVDRCRLYHNISLEEADQAVKQYFNLPSNFNYAEQLHSPKMKTYFNSENFLQAAYATGTLDAYIDNLVKDLVSNDTAPVLTGSLLPDPVLEIAGVAGPVVAATSLTYGILKDFNVIHTTNPDLNAINARLDKQKSKLEEIDQHIQEVLNATNKISQQIECGTRSTVVTLLTDHLSNAENPINIQATNYWNAYSRYVQNAGPDFTTEPQTVAAGIMAADLNKSIIDIKSLLVGNSTDPTTPGLLGQFAKELVDCRYPGRENLLTQYIELETFFVGAIGKQSQALNLITESHPVITDNLGWDRFPNLASTYENLKTYKSSHFDDAIEVEVDQFLRWVDYLVFSAADFGTDIAAAPQFLASDTEEVYARADLIAALLSGRHPKGISFRLIGDVEVVDAFCANQSAEIHQNYSPALSGVSNKWKSIEQVLYRPENMDTSHLGGYKTKHFIDQDTSAYLIDAFDDTYSAQQTQPHIEWHQKNDGSTWVAVPTKQVGVAKFVLTEVQLTSFVSRTTQEINGDAWRLYSNDRLVKPIELKVAGDIHDLFIDYDVQQMGDENTPVTTFPYGSYVFPIRRMPDGNAMKKADGNYLDSKHGSYMGDAMGSDSDGQNYATMKFDPNSMKVHVRLDINNIKEYPFKYYSSIHRKHYTHYGYAIGEQAHGYSLWYSEKLSLDTSSLYSDEWQWNINHSLRDIHKGPSEDPDTQVKSGLFQYADGNHGSIPLYTATVHINGDRAAKDQYKSVLLHEKTKDLRLMQQMWGGFNYNKTGSIIPGATLDTAKLKYTVDLYTAYPHLKLEYISTP